MHTITSKFEFSRAAILQNTLASVIQKIWQYPDNFPKLDTYFLILQCITCQNGQTQFKNLAAHSAKIFKECLTILWRYAWKGYINTGKKLRRKQTIPSVSSYLLLKVLTIYWKIFYWLSRLKLNWRITCWIGELT